MTLAFYPYIVTTIITAYIYSYFLLAVAAGRVLLVDASSSDFSDSVEDSSSDSELVVSDSEPLELSLLDSDSAKQNTWSQSDGWKITENAFLQRINFQTMVL